METTADSALRALAMGAPLAPESAAHAERVAAEASVLHWPIAFPEVFGRENRHRPLVATGRVSDLTG